MCLELYKFLEICGIIVIWRMIGMNVSLSCLANKEKGCFILSSNGRTECKELFSTARVSGGILKRSILESLRRGIKKARYSVSHEDLLIIEVQNDTIVDWFKNFEYRKEYKDLLDSIYDELELIDCRYRFLYSKNMPLCKKLLLQEPEKGSLTGMKDAFIDLGEENDEED